MFALSSTAVSAIGYRNPDIAVNAASGRKACNAEPAIDRIRNRVISDSAQIQRCLIPGCKSTNEADNHVPRTVYEVELSADDGYPNFIHICSWLKVRAQW